MTTTYTVQWSCTVEADNPQDAAYEAHDLLNEDAPCFVVVDGKGKETSILVADSLVPIYYRVVGLNSLLSLETHVLEAGDSYQARDIARGMGLNEILLVERTVLNELAEDDIRSWLAAQVGAMGRKITVHIASVGPETGTITLTDEQGVFEAHSFVLHSDGKDPGLIRSALQRVEYLSADCIITQRKVMRMVVNDFLRGATREIATEGAILHVLESTGQVNGWMASTMKGYRQACQVLVVDIVGDFDKAEGTVNLAEVGYWTQQGDRIPAVAKAPSPPKAVEAAL